MNITKQMLKDLHIVDIYDFFILMGKFTAEVDVKFSSVNQGFKEFFKYQLNYNSGYPQDRVTYRNFIKKHKIK